MDALRGTGRTTRQLKSCIEKARMGASIIFVLPGSSITYTLGMISKIEEPDSFRKRTAFYSNGSIRFVHPRTNPWIFEGLNADIEFDHAAFIGVNGPEEEEKWKRVKDHLAMRNL